MSAIDEASTPRFEFGQNWTRFLATLTEDRIAAAEMSVRRLLGHERLDGRTFLDAGCGSGLFSLAAFRLGARVTSFDYDAQCVACADRLRADAGAESPAWRTHRGSLLDASFLESLGRFDVVYCWGVAHHTGAMWTAIDLLTQRVAPGGQLVLAIYNDQDYLSRGWKLVKQIYQRTPAFLRPVLVAGIAVAGFAKRFSVTLLAALLRVLTLRNPWSPFRHWLAERQGRGMSWWTDLVDWVGGWPFEVAKPEEIFRFVRDRGFTLQELTTCSGHGCHEFVFRRDA